MVSCKLIGILVYDDLLFGKYFYLFSIGIGMVFFFSVI